MQGHFACIRRPVLHTQIWEDGRAGVGLGWRLVYYKTGTEFLQWEKNGKKI